MSVTVIATIGARDLRYPISPGRWRALDTVVNAENDALADVARQLECERGLRAASVALLHDKHIDTDLRFPILQPGIEYVLKHFGRIDRLLMVTTDQPESEPLRVNDTVDTARLLANRLPGSLRDQIDQIVSDFVALESPNAPSTYEILRSSLAGLVHSGPHIVVLLPTGGMPKVKDYLRLAAYYVFGLPLRVVEVDPPRPDVTGADQGTAVEVRDPFVREAFRQGSLVMIDRYDYQGALSALEIYAPESWPTDVMDALRKCAARMNLDFAEGGLGHYEESPLWAILGRSPEGDAFSRVTEVYHLIQICLEQSRYADAIFRVTLFLEACAWQGALHVLGREFDRYALDDRLPIDITARLHPVLARTLSDAETRSGLQRAPGDAQFWKIAIRTHRNAIFRYARTLNAGLSTLEQPRRGPLGALIDIRNNAVHFPTGLTCEHVAKALGVVAPATTLKAAVTDKLFSLLRPRLETLGGLMEREVRENPYRSLNDALRSRLLGVAGAGPVQAGG